MDIEQPLPVAGSVNAVRWCTLGDAPSPKLLLAVACGPKPTPKTDGVLGDDGGAVQGGGGSHKGEVRLYELDSPNVVAHISDHGTAPWHSPRGLEAAAPSERFGQLRRPDQEETLPEQEARRDRTPHQKDDAPSGPRQRALKVLRSIPCATVPHHLDLT